MGLPLDSGTGGLPTLLYHLLPQAKGYLWHVPVTVGWIREFEESSGIGQYQWQANWLLSTLQMRNHWQVFYAATRSFLVGWGSRSHGRKGLMRHFYWFPICHIPIFHLLPVLIMISQGTATHSSVWLRFCFQGNMDSQWVFTWGVVNISDTSLMTLHKRSHLFLRVLCHGLFCKSL